MCSDLGTEYPIQGSEHPAIKQGQSFENKKTV